MLGGVFICVCIGVLSWAGCSLLGIPGAATFAIFFGLILGNVSPYTIKQYKPGITYCEKVLLPLSIVLMGFSMEIGTLTSIGKTGSIAISASIFTALFAMTLLYLFNKRNQIILLLGVGNAICGSSAIAASSPVLKSNEAETGLSIAVVNLLGVIGIALMPALCHIFNFTEETSGILIGSSLQAVGQVSAAGYTVGAVSGEVATVIKMARILFLGPVILLLILFFSKPEKKNGLFTYIPAFIVGFFITFLLSNFLSLPTNVKSIIRIFEVNLLVSAMVAIGCKINVKALISQSSKALFWGLVIWLFQMIILVIVLFYMVRL